MSSSAAAAESLHSEGKANDVVVIGRRLNSLLSVETGYIITEGFSHHMASPERLLCPQSLVESRYQAINHRQSSTSIRAELHQFKVHSAFHFLHTLSVSIPSLLVYKRSTHFILLVSGATFAHTQAILFQ